MNLETWWRFKARETIKRYLKIVGFRRIYEITFWLTHRCVYNCSFCVIKENKSPFLPKEVVFAFVKEALPYKLGTVPITGGEPMLHPDFAEICHFVLDNVPTVGIHVTGRLLNDDILKEMEKRKRKWFWWLTIVAPDRELNDKYRARGAFEDAIRASALLKERKHGLGIAVNIVPETLPYLEESIRFGFEELKADYVTTEPIAPTGRAIEDIEKNVLNDEQLHSYYRRMTDLIPQWASKGKKLDALNIIYGLPQRCEFIWRGNGFNVHPTGLVNPCCFFLDEDMSLGKIEEGVKKCAGFFRFGAIDKIMRETHSNVVERVKKVGVWTCFECVLNYQVLIKGRKGLLNR